LLETHGDEELLHSHACSNMHVDIVKINKDLVNMFLFMKDISYSFMLMFKAKQKNPSYSFSIMLAIISSDFTRSTCLATKSNQM